MIRNILMLLCFVLSAGMLFLSIATSHDVHEFYHELAMLFLILGIVGVIRHVN